MANKKPQIGFVHFFKEKILAFDFNEASCKGAHYSLSATVKPKHSIMYPNLPRVLIPQHLNVYSLHLKFKINCL